MSDGLGECGCCEGPLQQRWAMALHQWWGDQVRGAPNSTVHYLRRIFTYTYHVEFGRRNGAVISSWDWTERGQIDQNKWTGENTVTEFAFVSGTKAPSYLLSTVRYADTSPTVFNPSFDYPPSNFSASTGTVANNWYTLQAWWRVVPNIDCFWFAGGPYGPFPGDYRQLGLDTISDPQFAELGLSVENIGEYYWSITLKTELKYDITQYVGKQEFLDNFAALKARVTFADIKAKTENQPTGYHFYYSAFFYDNTGNIVERNYYNHSEFNPDFYWAGANVPSSKYAEKVGEGSLSSLMDNIPGALSGSGVGGGTLHDFYSAIDCLLDVGGPMVSLSPRRDGTEGFIDFHSFFGGIYVISIYPIPSTVASFCLSRYASKPDAKTNNANADQNGSKRNGALNVDEIEIIESHITFPNPGASNIENQCSGGWTHEILTQGACE